MEKQKYEETNNTTREDAPENDLTPIYSKKDTKKRTVLLIAILGLAMSGTMIIAIVVNLMSGASNAQSSTDDSITIVDKTDDEDIYEVKAPNLEDKDNHKIEDSNLEDEGKNDTVKEPYDAVAIPNSVNTPEETIEALKNIANNYYEGNYYVVSKYSRAGLLYKPSGWETFAVVSANLEIKLADNNKIPNRSKYASNKSEMTSDVALERWGFTEYYEYLFGIEYLNSEKRIICRLAYRGEVPDNNVHCGDIDNIVDSSKKDLTNALAKAYRKKTGEDIGGIFYDDSVYSTEIQDGYEKPYQTITVGIVSASAFFYRKSPTSEWIFVSAGNGGCIPGDYESRLGIPEEEIRKSFGPGACL